MKAACKKYSFLLLPAFFSVGAFSQSQTYRSDTASADTTGKRSTFSGQVRYFFMATDNQQSFTDYHAHAVGAQAKYQTTFGKHFGIAAGASAVYNLSSSDMSQNDPLAKRPNRYEIGLYDVRYPDKKSIYRLEELYLQYSLPKGTIRLGNQLVNTPFINSQDGRMRPTFVRGLYSRLSLFSATVEGGWITAVLPRSVGNWHRVGSSVGLYPQGINQDGTPSNYGGNLSSRGIFIAGIADSISPNFTVTLWEQYAVNIFNTTLFQVDAQRKIWDQSKILASVQYIHQSKLNDGGCIETEKSYFISNKPAHVLSAMTGVGLKRFDGSLNYTHIFATARYLMPREWGREPFFTFMPRERNEGFGDVHAFVLKTTYRFPKYNLRTSLQAGHFLLPDVKDTRLNKYGMPSYSQLNAEVRYTPKFASAFDLQVLYVYKWNAGNTYQNPAFVFNKVNMSLYNVVVNYNWQLRSAR